jgi:hypothetical protein
LEAFDISGGDYISARALMLRAVEKGIYEILIQDLKVEMWPVDASFPHPRSEPGTRLHLHVIQ